VFDPAFDPAFDPPLDLAKVALMSWRQPVPTAEAALTSWRRTLKKRHQKPLQHPDSRNYRSKIPSFGTDG